MRLRKKPWIDEAIKQYESYIPAVPPEENWQAVFGRDAPLYVELGVGKGRFICELASRNPGINCVGIEAQKDVLYYAAQKVAERGLTNVRLLHFDADYIEEVFAPGEITRLYINFCDPWPKKRHAKRRLTHRRFLDKYSTVLTAGGELFFKSDNVSLFEYSLNQFADEDLKLRNISLNLHKNENPDNIMTEYEVKFSAKGMPIYRCEVIFS